MKKILLIACMVFVFTSCDYQTKVDEVTDDLSQLGQVVKDKVDEVVDQDKGNDQENQNYQSSNENPNIEEDYPKEENVESKVQNENIVENEEKTYDDLSFIDCYRDILNSDLPLRDYISTEDNSHIITYLNDDTYVDGKYFKTSYQHGSYYFNLIDHKDFKYPLLVLKEKSKMFSSIVIVQYLGDGKYNTMGYLGGSEISSHPENLYFDEEGNLYADSSYYQDEIYGINKVDDRLMANFLYTADSKGKSTKLYADYYSEPPIEKIDENYPNGVDNFDRLMIFDDTKEDFSLEELNAFREKLRPVELFDLSIEKYNEVAKENFANKKNIAVGPKTRGSSIEDKDAYAKMLNFIRKNLNVSQQEGKEEEVYIADYDNNGKIAAFVVAMNKDYKPELVFVDEDLNIKKVKDLIDMKPYAESGGYYKILNGGVFDAGNDQYLAIEENYGSSNSDCYIYSVANNKVYEPDISTKVATFYKDGDTYANKYYYHEYTEMGGSLQEGIEYYKYYQVDRQFEKNSANASEEEIDLNEKSDENSTIEEAINLENEEENSEQKIAEEKIEEKADNKKIDEEKQVEIEANDKINTKLRANVKDVKPIISIEGAEDGLDYVGNISLRVLNYKDYPPTARIIVKAMEFIKEDKDGYLISEKPIDIEVKQWLLFDWGKDRTISLSIQIVDGENKSEKYTYCLNPVFNNNMKKISSGDYLRETKFRSYMGQIKDINTKSRDKYAFIQDIYKPGKYDKATIELRDKWFDYAETMTYLKFLKNIKVAESSKYSKSDFKSLSRLSSHLRDISLAKEILSSIKDESVDKTIKFADKKYIFHYDMISVGMAVNFDGYISDEDGNLIKGLDLLKATSKVDPDTMKINDAYMKVIGTQIFANSVGAGNAVKEANRLVNLREINISDAERVFNMIYSCFDDDTIKSKKNRILISKSLGLYNEGIDFFTVCEALNNISNFKNENFNTTLAFNVEKRDLNDLYKDSLTVMKYLGKLDKNK